MSKKIKEWSLEVVAILPEEVREYNGRTYSHTPVDFTDGHESEYPSDYRLEVAPARYKLLHGLEEGDKVQITASLTGNRGSKGVFLKLQLLELKIIEKGSGQPVVARNVAVNTGAGNQPVNKQDLSQPAGFAPAEKVTGNTDNVLSDDLPF